MYIYTIADVRSNVFVNIPYLLIWRSITSLMFSNLYTLYDYRKTEIVEKKMSGNRSHPWTKDTLKLTGRIYVNKNGFVATNRPFVCIDSRKSFTSCTRPIVSFWFRTRIINRLFVYMHQIRVVLPEIARLKQDLWPVYRQTGFSPLEARRCPIIVDFWFLNYSNHSFSVRTIVLVRENILVALLNKLNTARNRFNNLLIKRRPFLVISNNQVTIVYAGRVFDNNIIVTSKI